MQPVRASPHGRRAWPRQAADRRLGRGTQVLLPARRTGLARDSKAQAEQVRSLDVSRVGRAVGALPDDLEHALDRALMLHLGLA